MFTIRFNYWLVVLTACVLVACNAETKPEKPYVPEKPKETRITQVVEKQPVVVKPKVSKWSRFPQQYDESFKTWSKRFLPGHDYTMLKAQCYQESLLKYDAVSPVGAKGLCQFMDFTWGEVAGDLKFPREAHAFNPELSIQAAAFYDAKIRRMWKAERPEYDRMNLTFASYNAGAGNIIKSQRKCNGLNLYDEIIECLPQVTGHHSKETMTYVKRIRKYEKQMILED